jgi:hypothetical protein
MDTVDATWPFLFLNRFYCKTNTIPILMHQIRILTTFKSLFSGIQAEKVEIQKKKKIVKTVQEPKKNKYCAMKLSQLEREHLWYFLVVIL